MSSFLDLAESRAKRNIPMTMNDWSSLLDKYFEVNIIKPNLANSDGWIPKLPIPNQLLLPFLTDPIPGIATKINNKKWGMLWKS